MTGGFASGGARSVGNIFWQKMCIRDSAAEKKEIAVSVDCPENLRIAHDSKWTSEALFNLLDNAVKYTPSGGKISVSVVQWEMLSLIHI